ncbi:hypothetical protein [Halosimplex salinum]|uniref:hypothetical protein n=1 Tax=Halosimplex salinum TaxID=1710538 RepID=UPI000F4844AD|nr:hypothetical protein [Halosimplex salinum]
MPSPRRTFLKRATGVLLAGSIAGCLSDGDATDTPDRPAGATDTAPPDPTAAATATETATATEPATATDTATATETPTPVDGSAPLSTADYAAWFPAPAALGQDHYEFTSIAPAAIVAQKSALGDGTTEGLRSDANVPGVDTYADATKFHQIGLRALVFEGGVDRESAAEGFRSRGLSETDTRHGFAVFTAGGDGGGAAALSENALVSAPAVSDGTQARATVEAVVDAKAGAGERYVDAADDCDRLATALGSAHLLRGRTHPVGETFDGAVAGGLGIEVDGAETHVTTPVVFREGRTDAKPLADWADETDVFYGQEPDIATDGRVATATATVPSGEIGTFRSDVPGQSGGRGSETPTATFGYDYEETGDGVGVLEVTHDGGESIPRDELFLHGSGFADVDEVDQTEGGQWQGTASADDESVIAGDFVEVGAASDYEISVVWQSPDGDASATIMHGEGPDA